MLSELHHLSGHRVSNDMTFLANGGAALTHSCSLHVDHNQVKALRVHMLVSHHDIFAHATREGYFVDSISVSHSKIIRSPSRVNNCLIFVHGMKYRQYEVSLAKI